MYKEELNTRGDSDFAYANEFARYRTSVVRQRLGIEIVFRVINTHVRTMDELGLPEHLKLLTRYQNGLILATGSVGTGKSTTLAAMIEQINTERRDHIITLEDPIEYIIQSKNCHVTPARSLHAHRVVRHGTARVAPGRSGRDHGWRNARPGNDLTRHHRVRNRASCPGNTAHE